MQALGIIIIAIVIIAILLLFVSVIVKYKKTTKILGIVWTVVFLISLFTGEFEGVCKTFSAEDWAGIGCYIFIISGIFYFAAFLDELSEENSL